MTTQSHPLLKSVMATLEIPPDKRPQEKIHECSILLSAWIKPFSLLSYQQMVATCRSLTSESVQPRTRLTDEDENKQVVFRIVLDGSVLVERRFGKSWLHVGFMRRGDTLGVAAQLEGTVDYNVMYTSAHSGAQFATLSRYTFERSLRQSYEKAVEADVQMLASIPSFAPLPEPTLRHLCAASSPQLQPAFHSPHLEPLRPQR